MGNKLYQEDLRRPQDSELYAYDDLYRLTSWERGELNAEKDAILNPVADQSWNLDPVGNWDETTHDGTVENRQHNEVNELIHRDNEITTGLIYDDNGNLIEDHQHEYAYDSFNRLVKVKCRDKGDMVAAYRYDTENRRVERIVENSGGLNGATQYVYDGWQVVEEREVRGGGPGRGRGGPPDHAGPEDIRTYTYGNYIDEPLTMTAGRGDKTYYYHTNNLYNVRALTDERGRVVERYRYSAYGRVKVLNRNDNPRLHSTVDNVYLFQGRRYDPETGLYYYRNRMMSAELGRFLQRDPLGYVDGWNLYEFVGSNTLIHIDSMGTDFRIDMPSLECCTEEERNRQTQAYNRCIENAERIYRITVDILQETRRAVIAELEAMRDNCIEECEDLYDTLLQIAFCEHGCIMAYGYMINQFQLSYLGLMAAARLDYQRDRRRCRRLYPCAER